MFLRDVASLVVLPFLAGAVVTTLGLAAARMPARAESDRDPLWQAAQAFRRPVGLPVAPADATGARVELGRDLFADKRLSGNTTVSCAGCHDPALALSDGVPRGKGVGLTALPRHTPHLWNLAWEQSFFWDGRAASLEDQARGPIENPLEMGGNLEAIARTFGNDATTQARFAAAFPDKPFVSPTHIVSALAAYERTLVSPVTRFDRWVSGDRHAVDDREKLGFALFLGKAGCVTCHSGWAFTDHAYHDIGLPGSDIGRGGVIGVAAANHAFRTPGLRELTWTAPYMHDGSLPTLEAVLDHYEHGIVERPSLSPDLKRIALSPEEREAITAFLATLSSEDPPQPSSLPAVPTLSAQPADLPHTRLVYQRDKAFAPTQIALTRGDSLTIVNDDRRTHNIRIDSERQRFDSGAQEPGQSVSVPFPDPGSVRIYCGIHPAMQLTVVVGN